MQNFWNLCHDEIYLVDRCEASSRTGEFQQFLSLVARTQTVEENKSKKVTLRTTDTQECELRSANGTSKITKTIHNVKSDRQKS